ncbi:MAG: SDR family oxidoreductase [Verrucomicrobiota bacterium]|nr:SDR family oxidoreductase [Verrucomicrobiota bacterium]
MPATNFDIRGRIAVVTGGLGQLGRQFCRTFLEAGARVVVLDQRIDEALLAERFGPQGRDILGIEADVSSRSSMDAALRRVVDELKESPHILVNNAALDSPPNACAADNGPFETFPEESWSRVLDVNLKGTMIACQVFGGAMAVAGRGSIVNVCSIYGMVSPDQRIYDYRRKNGEEFFKPVAYAASKSGLLNLTRYLATYWAPQGVRVNTVTFAGVFNNQPEEFLKGYCVKVPLGRMAREDEYNGAVLFLTSDASSYMTGSNMIIDGGYTAW